MSYTQNTCPLKWFRLFTPLDTSRLERPPGQTTFSLHREDFRPSPLVRLCIVCGVSRHAVYEYTETLVYLSIDFAEGEGFEPPKRFTACLVSSEVPSTARPTFHPFNKPPPCILNPQSHRWPSSFESYSLDIAKPSSEYCPARQSPLVLCVEEIACIVSAMLVS